MTWLAWAGVGLVSGWLAGLATRSDLGILGDLVAGLIGAFIGGILFNLTGRVGVTGFNPWSILVAFVGAVVLLLIIRGIRSGVRHAP